MVTRIEISTVRLVKQDPKHDPGWVDEKGSFDRTFGGVDMHAHTTPEELNRSLEEDGEWARNPGGTTDPGQDHEVREQ